MEADLTFPMKLRLVRAIRARADEYGLHNKGRTTGHGWNMELADESADVQRWHNASAHRRLRALPRRTELGRRHRHQALVALGTGRAGELSEWDVASGRRQCMGAIVLRVHLTARRTRIDRWRR